MERTSRPHILIFAVNMFVHTDKKDTYAFTRPRTLMVPNATPSSSAIYLLSIPE